MGEENFNPRSHCRERPADGCICRNCIRISIHVPIAGNDTDTWSGRQRTGYFNPRSHCRERHRRKPILLEVIYISIHVPIAGNDEIERNIRHYAEVFQSTFPLQGTTGIKEGANGIEVFQSTFPLQGTTANLSNF